MLCKTTYSSPINTLVMFKYRWTPFQLLALVSVTLAICDAVAISRMNGEPGLGGLAPIIYACFAVGVFIVDVILQTIFIKSRNVFFVIETILLLVIVIWIFSLGGI